MVFRTGKHLVSILSPIVRPGRLYARQLTAKRGDKFPRIGFALVL